MKILTKETVLVNLNQLINTMSYFTTSLRHEEIFFGITF